MPISKIVWTVTVPIPVPTRRAPHIARRDRCPRRRTSRPSRTPVLRDSSLLRVAAARHAREAYDVVQRVLSTR